MGGAICLNSRGQLWWRAGRPRSFRRLTSDPALPTTTPRKVWTENLEKKKKKVKWTRKIKLNGPGRYSGRNIWQKAKCISILWLIPCFTGRSFDSCGFSVKGFSAYLFLAPQYPVTVDSNNMSNNLTIITINSSSNLKFCSKFLLLPPSPLNLY